jgi:hypothetical protein
MLAKEVVAAKELEMTVTAIRDDRIDQEERNQFTRATQQAAARRQEIAAAEETAAGSQAPSGDVIRRLDGLSDTLQTLTTRVARLEASQTGGQVTRTGRTSTPASGTSIPTSMTTPTGADEPVSSGSESSPGDGPEPVSRAVGTVAENFPWPWPFDPPPPPVLSRTQGPDFIDGPNGNAFIDTVAHLTQSGQLQATTHVQATNLFGGVTTGTLIVVADESGRIIARSGLQQIGVDGTWVPFKESNRTVPWNEEFGADVAARARAMYVAHFHAGRNRLVEDLNAIFNVVTDVGEFVASFCSQNPAICSAVASAFA